jgi:histidyl-tRNA synthetase
VRQLASCSSKSESKNQLKTDPGVCQTCQVAPVNAVRGMRDFLPADKQVRDALLSKITEVYRKRGFQQIETPALEDLARLTSGQGGDNEKLVFQVLKRGEDLENAIANAGPLADIGLRFDLTVPLTRYYASNHSKLPRVLKAMQVGPVWRAERPQKGRYRQFLQCDIDIIGESGVQAEVELLLASLDALAAIGLPEAVIRVNHRALLTELMADFGVPEAGFESALITIDKLDKIDIAGVVAELTEKFDATVAARAESWLRNRENQPTPAVLEPIFDAVAQLQPGRLRFDPTLVRGMGYYTGAIFEIEHPKSTSSIGGGGRYDGMVGRWLGADVPAVGISIGFERVVELVAGAEPTEQALVLVYEPQQLISALRLQREAIASGWQVRLETRPKNLKAALASLAEQGFTHFGVVAESSFEELELKPIAQ